MVCPGVVCDDADSGVHVCLSFVGPGVRGRQRSKTATNTGSEGVNPLSLHLLGAGFRCDLDDGPLMREAEVDAHGGADAEAIAFEVA
ncbi:hypothetical protein MGALJ_10050 [Mycobacterium gallinarum]|uniref:Uncharacterized protein n=1 Tax=Mycobacterium gallinarum TaxID=39689 RepID=A0A9W4AZL9_9MYCO|nr:hypothetical protein MGALJ_10050 [Mycobacterium gallinarum]